MRDRGGGGLVRRDKRKGVEKGEKENGGREGGGGKREVC